MEQISPSPSDNVEFEKDSTQKIRCTCIQEDQQSLESINPFRIEFSMLSMQVREINKNMALNPKLNLKISI